VTIRRLPILIALVVAALAVLGVASPAMAAKPCWKQLLNDWYDGRIDNAYSVRCYREAIRNLPEDVEAYSRAREDINRALLAAIRAGERSGNELGVTDLVPPEPDTDTTDTLPSANGEEEATPGGGLGGPLGPSSADSVPIPLLVLAGLALILLAAASAGFVARRIQSRRVRLGPLPQGPPEP
jgi:hypothetical protein